MIFSKFKQKLIFLAAFITVLYFLFLYLNSNYFKIDFILLGILQEFVTLPMMLLQFVLLFFSTASLFCNTVKNKSYPLLTITLLVLALFAEIYSFF